MGMPPADSENSFAVYRALFAGIVESWTGQCRSRRIALCSRELLRVGRPAVVHVISHGQIGRSRWVCFQNSAFNNYREQSAIRRGVSPLPTARAHPRAGRALHGILTEAT